MTWPASNPVGEGVLSDVVRFEIEYIAKDWEYVLARQLERRDFELVEGATLGGCTIRAQISQPRALDENGAPRTDLFLFVPFGPRGELSWVVGDVVSLGMGPWSLEDSTEGYGGRLEARFGKKQFELAAPAGRSVLCRELAALLAQRLREPSAFGATAAACIEELVALGHDLWSFDESDDFEIWCPNWKKPSGPGLVVTFRAPDEVSVEWSAE